MKTLLLLRHAKSSWDDERLADFDRPLNERGRNDAPRVGQLMRRLDLVPDLIITSSAKRARKTAELAAGAASYDGDIQQTRQLYLAEPQAYIDLARRAGEHVTTLMMVGHNPGIEQLVATLGGSEEHMPTAALAAFRIPIESWSELRMGPCEIVGIWRPKEL
jgi:phosphohistidine phosphatase